MFPHASSFHLFLRISLVFATRCFLFLFLPLRVFVSPFAPALPPKKSRCARRRQRAVEQLHCPPFSRRLAENRTKRLVPQLLMMQRGNSLFRGARQLFAFYSSYAFSGFFFPLLVTPSTRPFVCGFLSRLPENSLCGFFPFSRVPFAVFSGAEA